MRTTIRLMTAAMAAVTMTTAARAATYYADASRPDDSGKGTSAATAKRTLQAAVNLAKKGDTVIVADGTYAPISTANKAITIQSVNGPNATFIDGNNAGRCATLGEEGKPNATVLTGFTLQNGNSDGNGGGAWGGTLNDCVLYGNKATNGGGASGCTLNYCEIYWNSTTGANTHGGGAYACTLTECILSQNTAQLWGGGAYDCTLTNCYINYNTAYSGGGAQSSALHNCVLSYNTADIGGADRYGTLSNCLLFRNSARVGGGTVFGKLYNCTVANNSASGEAGGVYNATVYNSIVWGNTLSDGTSIDNHASSTFRHSCSTGLSGDGNIALDPKFYDPSYDFGLRPDSPCINAGDNAYAPDGKYDLDGGFRIVGTVDMGAYERNNFQITFDANGGAFPGGGTTTTAWVWYGDNYHFPAAPVRDGHIFLGWCPGLLGRPITASTRVDATTVFNACWASADAATVALPFADGPGDVSSGAAVVNGKPVTLTAKPHKDALFLEWTSSDGDVFSTPTIKVAPAQTTAYVARFRYKADCEPPEVTVGKKSNWAMVGVPLTVDIFVNDAARPVKFSAAKLPPGLKINPATGQVTGIPTKAGTYVGATVTATSLADPKKKTSVTSPPMTVQPLPASVVGTFNGYVQDSDGNMNGAFTATISASGKITAKATTADGTFSFAVPSFSESTWSGGGQFVVEAKTAKGQTLCLEIDGFFPWSQWQYTYGGLNGTHNIIVQRNPFIDKNDANKDAAVAYFAPHSKQYCTLVLANGGIIHNSGDAGNNPEGYGYLTITASDKGSAKLAGKLADGTAVSGSAVLFTGAFGEAWAYGFVPLYGKQGFLSSEFYLNTDGTLGGCALWHYPGKTPAGKAPATEDRFSIWLDARGGRYTPPASLAAYYAQALAFFIGNPSAPGNWMSAVEILEGSRGALLLPKAKAPFLDKGTGLYVFTPGNPTVATLTANAKTGLFSGTFNWYDEVPDGKGGSKPKATTVKHQGVLTQQGGAFPGAGHYLLPSPYADPANPKAKYNLKRSYPVIIDLRDTM